MLPVTGSTPTPPALANSDSSAPARTPAPLLVDDEEYSDPIDVARAALEALIGSDDPDWRVSEIVRNLPTRKKWRKYDYEDFYGRDVPLLVALCEFRAARIKELEMVSDCDDQYLHAAKEHIKGQNAEIERLRGVVAELAAKTGGAL